MGSKFTLSLLSAVGFVGLAGAAARADETIARADAVLAPYRALPTFEAPGESFDAKTCMAGKKILSIPASSAIPFISTINQNMQRIAKDLGFEYQIWENQGQTSQHVQGMNHATSNGFDLIELLAGTDPRALVPQTKEAQAAGIKVVASHLTGFEQGIPAEIDGVVPIDYKRAGELMAHWAISKKGKETNALVLVSTPALSTDSLSEGVTSVFDKDCPDCTYSVVNVPIPDWATKIQSTVQSQLIANPDINYIIPIYDSMSQFVVPALTITGRDDVKIATFNGTPFVISMIQNGQVEMNIGENLDWIAHGMLDSHMRRLCGLDIVADPKIPLMIFDESNAATAGTPAVDSKGYGDAYVEGYRTLWKLN